MKLIKSLKKLFDFHFNYPTIGLEVFYRGLGFVGFTCLIVLGVFYGLLEQTLEHFFYTTYITSICISLVFMLNFKNRTMNTLSCIPFIWFIFLTDFHFYLGIIQLILILTKAPVNKRSLMFSFLFLLCFGYLYDDLSRIQYIIPIFPSTQSIQLMVFYSLILSTLIIYQVKKWRGVCVSD